MIGCNKTLTDPTYYGQLVLFTFPSVGNCGLITADFESEGVHAFGCVMRELCDTPSNFRMEGTLGAYLQKADIPGICGVDTRRLTAILRDCGTMNACICADPTAIDLNTVKSYAVGDAVAAVSIRQKTTYKPDKAARCRVALLDYGTKAELLRELLGRGCEVTVYPQDTPGRRRSCRQSRRRPARRRSGRPEGERTARRTDPKALREKAALCRRPRA